MTKFELNGIQVVKEKGFDHHYKIMNSGESFRMNFGAINVTNGEVHAIIQQHTNLSTLKDIVSIMEQIEEQELSI